jgi:hypothetical protein
MKKESRKMKQFSFLGFLTIFVFVVVFTRVDISEAVVQRAECVWPPKPPPVPGGDSMPMDRHN